MRMLPILPEKSLCVSWHALKEGAAMCLRLRDDWPQSAFQRHRRSQVGIVREFPPGLFPPGLWFFGSLGLWVFGSAEFFPGSQFWNSPDLVQSQSISRGEELKTFCVLEK